MFVLSWDIVDPERPVAPPSSGSRLNPVLSRASQWSFRGQAGVTHQGTYSRVRSMFPRSSFYPVSFFKVFPFSLLCDPTSLIYQVSTHMRFIHGLSIRFHRSSSLCLSQCHTVLITMTLYKLWYLVGQLLHLFFFFSSLYFYMNFPISLLNSTCKTTGILIGIYRTYIKIWEKWHLYITDSSSINIACLYIS